jgi:coenzyme Q-binding protein COQ10
MKTLRPITRGLSTPTRPLTPQCRTTANFSSIYTNRTNHNRHPQHHACRAFSFNPLESPSQEITAHRTLPYPSKVIYSIISDVSSYDHFLPYCQSSVVTKTSQPASDGKTYPEEAKLSIGFSDSVSEEFWSRVYCIPHHTVEAVSGQSETSLNAADITHHSSRPSGSEDPTRNESVLSHLSTRWMLKPYHYKPPPTSAIRKDSVHKNHEETSEVPGQEKTEVSLTVQFKFANPVYAALSQAAAPKVAEKMIDAFEKRVRAVVEGPANV